MLSSVILFSILFLSLDIDITFVVKNPAIMAIKVADACAIVNINWVSTTGEIIFSMQDDMHDW